MKKLFVAFGFIFALGLFANAHADIEGTPYIPEIDNRFDKIEEGYFTAPATLDGHHRQQVVQATYDFSKQTGAVKTYQYPNATLPKGAIITRSYAYSITQPTTSASGTLAWSCQNQGNIFAATAAASYGAAASTVDGVESGAASAFRNITVPCILSATIGTGALTAGKVTVFVEYVTHQ